MTTPGKPSCESVSNLSSYNTPLHVGAIFIILFVSFTACAFPLIVVRFPRLRIPPTFLFIVRHFGTGVLIDTAFVHLLPTAFISLTDPCLPKFWNEDYPAMAGALALAAVFLIAVVEMVFSPGKNGCAMPVGVVEESVGRKEKVNVIDSGENGVVNPSAEEENKGMCFRVLLLHSSPNVIQHPRHTPMICRS
jgi:hypothetical protein